MRRHYELWVVIKEVSRVALRRGRAHEEDNKKQKKDISGQEPLFQ